MWSHLCCHLQFTVLLIWRTNKYLYRTSLKQENLQLEVVYHSLHSEFTIIVEISPKTRKAAKNSEPRSLSWKSQMTSLSRCAESLKCVCVCVCVCVCSAASPSQTFSVQLLHTACSLDAKNGWEAAGIPTHTHTHTHAQTHTHTHRHTHTQREKTEVASP